MTPNQRRTAFDDNVAAGLRALPDWRGKAILALAWRRLRERGGPLDGAWHIRLADGSSVSVPRASRMSWSVAATGYWDRPVIEFIERFVTSATLTLDIGASVGLWSVALGRIVQERDGRLWCFEPNPENLPWLRANIEENGLGAVTKVQPVALGARTGNAQLGLREPGGGNAAITHDADDHAAVAVDIRRLDDYDFPCRVSFVKMDVEGFELEVLRGARALLERDRPVILGEFSEVWLHERGEDLPGQLRELTSLGYDVFALEQHRSARWRPHDVVSLRRLRPPFSISLENLVLIPR